MLPRQFGHYELKALLGTGGMGEVYLAQDTQRDRQVALKLLPEIFSDDHEYLSRFRRESYVAARLREPHVIPIHDFGEIDNRLFIDMRLVDGKDIGKILEENGPLSPARASHLVSQIAEALDAAHADGLVHRDIKPSNVLVTATDFVYVVDFGVARSVGSARTSLTITGATVGTLDYMAPERFTLQPVDCRTDVYSLACLLYECLTANRPFPGEDLPSLMYAHLYTAPPEASSVVDGVPAALDAVISCGMAKDPTDRYPTAGALAAATRDAVAASAPAATRDAVAASAPAPTPRAPTTARLPLPPAVDQPERTDEPADAPDLPARIGSLGLASANGGHRSADPLPAPGAAPSAGTEIVAPPPPAAPPPAESNLGRRRWPLVAVLAVVVVVALVVLTVALIRAPGAGVASGGGPAVAPLAPASIAPSVAVPTVRGTVPVGSTPGYIHVAPNGRFAYIANREAGVVTVLDTTINQVTATIAVPQGPPQFVSFSPDGRTAYVSIFNTDRTVNLVAFMDTATNTITSTIPVGRRPFASSTNPDGSRLYVPSHDDARVEVIDTATAELITQIPVARNPHWVAFGKDGRFFYTANHESNVLSVLDAGTNGVVTEIPVGTSPHSTAVSPDGSRVSVVNFDSNEVSVIDTATNTVVATVPVGLRPQDIAYAPDGRFFYVANVDSDTISVVNTATNQITATIPSSDAPTSISVLPDGRQAYVTNLNTGVVLILDVALP